MLKNSVKLSSKEMTSCFFSAALTEGENVRVRDDLSPTLKEDFIDGVTVTVGSFSFAGFTVTVPFFESAPTRQVIVTVVVSVTVPLSWKSPVLEFTYMRDGFEDVQLTTFVVFDGVTVALKL